MSKPIITSHIKAVMDFPIPGVSFKDIGPLLRNHFKLTIDEFEKLFTKAEWQKVDYLIGIESRGFIFASALAERLDKGLVLIRKKGKLPGKVASISCKLEYGEVVLEMHHGEGNVLIIDDVLASGGTFTASADLATQSGYHVLGFAVLMNLTYLNNFSWNGMTARSILNMDQ